jgi:hypothetical protein
MRTEEPAAGEARRIGYVEQNERFQVRWLAAQRT